MTILGYFIAILAALRYAPASTYVEYRVAKALLYTFRIVPSPPLLSLTRYPSLGHFGVTERKFNHNPPQQDTDEVHHR
jgi:hypothetical protein